MRATVYSAQNKLLTKTVIHIWITVFLTLYIKNQNEQKLSASKSANKGAETMRRYILLFIAFALISTTSTTLAHTNERTIIEVEGDVESIEYINNYHPFIEIITSYSTILMGRLRRQTSRLRENPNRDFIKAIHKTSKSIPP